MTATAEQTTGWERTDTGVVRRHHCQRTGARLSAHVEQRPDGACYARAVAYHPHANGYPDELHRRYFGLRAGYGPEFWADLERAMQRAEEMAQALAEWLGAEWPALDAPAPEPDPEGALPTDPAEFWRLWGRLDGPRWREQLTPAEKALRARMAPLVDERLGVGR